MSDQEQSKHIDARQCGMLDVLFEAVDNTGEDADAKIGNLVRHFRELLLVEAGLPEDTRLLDIRNNALGPIASHSEGAYPWPQDGVFSAESIGHKVRALKEATSGIPDKDDPEARKAAYQYIDRLGDYNVSPGVLTNATKLCKITGQAAVVVPGGLLADDELFETFLKEVEQRDDLRDGNNLRQAILSFALNHDRRKIAISVIELYLDKQFIMDNFDWICEGAKESWIIEIILGVEEVRNDRAKVEKLLKKLAEGNGLIYLFIDSVGDDNKLRCGKEFAHYLAKWALANLESIKCNLDLQYLAYVAADEDFPKLVDELEKRGAWEDIAYIRLECHSIEKRHHAQQVLDRNVDGIPTAEDLESGKWTLEGNNDGCGPSVFAIIGTIGMDENARLRAVERIKTDGLPMMGTSHSHYPKQILETIIKGSKRHNQYDSPAVKAAAQKALEELKAASQATVL